MTVHGASHAARPAHRLTGPGSALPRRTIARLMRDWHGVAGIVAAFSLIVIVGSGIALNHTDALGLAHQEVRSEALARWYGLRTQAPESGFRLGDAWLVAQDERWVFGGRVLPEHFPPAIGAAVFDRWVVVTTGEALYLFERSGRMVDRIDRAGLPAVPIRALATDAQHGIVLSTAKGTFESIDGIDWKRSALTPRWSAAEVLPAQVKGEIAQHFVPGIQTERLLRDIHSGRILGPAGPWLVDGVAVLLVLLAASGAWMFLRSANGRRRQARPRRPSPH